MNNNRFLNLWSAPNHYNHFLFKIEWFIDFPATNKIDNLTCVDYHETHYSILFYFCGAIGVFFFYNKQNNN